MNFYIVKTMGICDTEKCFNGSAKNSKFCLECSRKNGKSYVESDAELVKKRYTELERQLCSRERSECSIEVKRINRFDFYLCGIHGGYIETKTLNEERLQENKQVDVYPNKIVKPSEPQKVQVNTERDLPKPDISSEKNKVNTCILEEKEKEKEKEKDISPAKPKDAKPVVKKINKPNKSYKNNLSKESLCLLCKNPSLNNTFCAKCCAKSIEKTKLRRSLKV